MKRITITKMLYAFTLTCMSILFCNAQGVVNSNRLVIIADVVPVQDFEIDLCSCTQEQLLLEKTPNISNQLDFYWADNDAVNWDYRVYINSKSWGSTSGSDFYFRVNKSSAGVAQSIQLDLDCPKNNPIVMEDQVFNLGFNAKFYEDGFRLSLQPEKINSVKVYRLKNCGSHESRLSNSSTTETSVPLSNDSKNIGNTSTSILFKNAPNPFAKTTTIEYKLLEDATVSLAIYNSLGQEVEKVVVDKLLAEGTYQYEIGDKLNPGIYIARLLVNEEQQLMKIIKTD